MKLAVLTCGMLPIPAVQGGAVLPRKRNIRDRIIRIAGSDPLQIHFLSCERLGRNRSAPGSRSVQILLFPRFRIRYRHF